MRTVYVIFAQHNVCYKHLREGEMTSRRLHSAVVYGQEMT